ncbi:hypothetical protein GWL_43540 [Herbaspirillum sp. GW103]|nr:hypothetical protein GWL_43540 [Herbaspirillum sp. GW103]
MRSAPQAGTANRSRAGRNRREAGHCTVELGWKPGKPPAMAGGRIRPGEGAISSWSGGPADRP